MKAEAAAMGIFISLYGHRANGYEEVLSREAKERVELLQARTFVHPLDGRAWPEFQFRMPYAHASGFPPRSPSSSYVFRFSGPTCL